MVGHAISLVEQKRANGRTPFTANQHARIIISVRLRCSIDHQVIIACTNRGLIKTNDFHTYLRCAINQAFKETVCNIKLYRYIIINFLSLNHLDKLAQNYNVIFNNFKLLYLSQTMIGPQRFCGAVLVHTYILMYNLPSRYF